MSREECGVSLRLARESDAETIVRIQFEAFHAAASAFYPTEVMQCWAPEPSAPRADELRLAIAREGPLWIVAELEGTLVGFGSLAAPARELRGVYVVASAARRGVGGSIVAELERLASVRGVTSLELIAPLNAEKFFARRGYRVVGRHIERFAAPELRMACLKMQKGLPAAVALPEHDGAAATAPASSESRFVAVYPIGDTLVLGLPIREVGPAVGYYTRVLGFTLVEKTKESAILARDAVRIGLCVNGEDPEQASCYIEVSDVAALQRELAEKGIEPSDVREEHRAGKLQRIFFAKEPFGVCFCFGQTER